MLDADTLDVALIVTAALDALNVPYVIGGSVASAAHGQVRSTLDVDIVADLKQEHVTALMAAVADRFYIDETAVRQAIERRSSFNLIYLPTMVKADIFLPSGRPFDGQQLARRIAERLHPDSTESLWILTAEDTILAKLDWFRQGGELSERQWRDTLGVIKTQGARLDIDYLRRWASALNVLDLLERALQENSS